MNILRLQSRFRFITTLVIVVVFLATLIPNKASAELNSFCVRNNALTVANCEALMKKAGIYFVAAETSINNNRCSANSSVGVSALKAGSKVFILGDSITAAAAASYESLIGSLGASVTVDASTSRSITGKGMDGNKLSGIEAVAVPENVAAIKEADVVVIALGTNGNNTPQNMSQLMSAIKSNSKQGAAFFWVDTTVIGRKELIPRIKANNTAIYGQSSVLGYSVISWYKKVTPGGNPQEPSPTDTDVNGYIVQANEFVHPTTAGVEALTKTVVDGINSGGGKLLPTGVEIKGFFYGGVKVLPPSWVPILNEAGNAVGVDPAFLAAILGNETGWSPPEVFLQDPNNSSHGTISGPFQFAAATASTFKKDLTYDGNKDGVVDEKNPTDAAYMAAAFLKSMGASMNTPLGDAGDYAVSRNNQDGKVTVRTIAAHYNQGGGFNAPDAKTAADVDAKAIGGNIVSKYMDQAQKNTEALRLLETGGSVASSAACASANTLDNFVSYSQYDPRWADEQYGKFSDGTTSTIRAGGCGPSAMAMIITNLTGTEYTPLDAAKFGRENGTEDSTGGSLAGPLATELSNLKGLTASQITTLTAESINSVLAGGGMVLMGGKGSNPFTDGGHYIVIRGASPAGKWFIGDSNIEENNKLEFEPADILAKAKAGNVYAITK